MSDLTPDEIQQQMRQARRELGADVVDIAEQARVMTDWKYYVRSNPWLCLGAAATLGYLLVPQRIKLPPVSLEPMLEMVKATQAATQQAAAHAVKETIQATQPPPPPKQSLLSMALGMLGSTVLQGGMAIASQQLNSFLHQQLEASGNGPGQWAHGQRQPGLSYISEQQR